MLVLESNNILTFRVIVSPNNDYSSFMDAINGKSGVDIEPINNNTSMYYIVYYHPVKAASTTWAILFIHTLRLFK